MLKLPANNQTIDGYISMFPPHVQEILQKIRKVIHQAAPDANEAIKYQLATFQLNGNLVHFGAFAEHIGFYPTPSAIKHFKKELAGYETATGTIKFPLSEPIPFDLIREITEFRVTENLAKPKKKAYVRK